MSDTAAASASAPSSTPESSTPVSPVASTIARANSERAGAFVGYLPVGYPSLDESIDAAVALVENGVDVLELGLPYSDPVMDGPVIQAATVEALEKGVRLRDAFTAVERIRSRVDAPVLLMTYWNPVLQYGVDRFADDLVSAGGAGLITPDLTVDSGADWLASSDRTGLDRVFLAAPTSSDERLRLAVENSRGFVYTVSTMGITGARADLDAAARKLVDRLRAQGGDSLAVGIGISTADQISEILGYADGAIVGSALVKALADGGVPAVGRLAAELAEGTRR
ncbi:tryptophan synthase subunit alpha [Herbiconiux sp. A18JL235]|uniref:Tryptophan synthase alpha chain n=1 Tax=Herbiconiux sp. A18JL235 TaxID=3152363 RepID=A0AB39BBF1_9MICO